MAAPTTNGRYVVGLFGNGWHPTGGGDEIRRAAMVVTVCRDGMITLPWVPIKKSESEVPNRTNVGPWHPRSGGFWATATGQNRPQSELPGVYAFAVWQPDIRPPAAPAE
jgi:hypothetical protein